ncbi:MAG: DUF3553 domain-containing protein [Phycisphaerales bacterium]|nr:DUF3553 domain-containing protein [Phycisphaerales bacterium]
MIDTSYKKGDRVRHPSRPEWGTGVITKIESVTRDRSSDLRLWVRFPSNGEKTFLASAAGLEVVDDQGHADSVHARPTLDAVHLAKGGGWLGEISKRTPEELMVSLPGEAADPFLPLRKRAEFIVKLYRFDGTPVRLIEWAVAQSGVEDPMSRFNRQELEQFYTRWLFNLETQTRKLLTELRRDNIAVDALLVGAPPLAARTIPRLQRELR